MIIQCFYLYLLSKKNLMERYGVYLSGNFENGLEIIDVKDKYTGETIAEVSLANRSILETAIKNAIESEEYMANLSSSEKYTILTCIANKIYEKREFFAEIIAREAGKPLKYARIEAERASQTFMIAAEESRRIHSELIQLDWYSPLKKEALVKLFPVGLVAGITPFNFPLNLVAHKVAPAIAAGCPMILKPALNTPISSLELAKIIQSSALPAAAFSVIPMNHEVSKPLIEDDRFKKLSFTGSQAAGWDMKNRCGKKRVTLELGGNAAAIVTESCDFNEAVAKCVTGAFAYSGQVCIHTQRIYVHNRIYDKFVKAFLKKASALKYGNPIEETTDISVLIDEANAIRVEEWVKEAGNQGASILMGGKRQGAFIEPTVLNNTNPNMKIWKDEIFGPVSLIEPYESFSEAVDLVNNSIYGLQAGVFTNKIDEMNEAFKRIKTGGVMINESPTFRIDHAPYGGIKESGFGREGLRYAIHEMSEIKVLVKPC
jgi:acyl-CoA reductase-like NAD-dependent aldehyde dehydrogenase